MKLKLVMKNTQKGNWKVLERERKLKYRNGLGYSRPEYDLETWDIL